MSAYRSSSQGPLIVAGTRVVALDRGTGQPLWSYEGAARRVMRIHVTRDRVFLLDFEGNVHCLRLVDGGVVGVVALGGDECTMLAVDDTLYVFHGEKVTAIDAGGAIVWEQAVEFDGEWGLVGLGVIGREIQPDFSRS